MAKQESIPFLTPYFKARFPKISKPDTKGKYADGKFKTDGVMDDAAYAATEKTLKDAAKKFWPDQEHVTLPLKTFFANKDDKKAGKSDGRGIQLKSKYRPAVFDSKKKQLPDNVAIGGGSVIRVASSIFPWSKTEKTKVKNPDGTITVEEGTEYGVSLRLGDVQVRELVKFQSSGDGAAFDEDEGGFEYEGGTDDAAGGQFDEADATAL